MAIAKSLNDENTKLYQSLINNGLEIDFEIDPESPCWQVEEVMKYKISAPDDQTNAPALAHELLHIKLRQMGFWRSIDIFRYFNEKNSIFTPEFIANFDNQLAHFKMIDDFLKMGYNIDDFLQDTPKTYLLSGLILKAPLLVLQNASGNFNICEQTREIIHLVSGAKLFELYQIKDPLTQNGVHPDIILDSLRKINDNLISELVNLFDEWNATNSVENIQFYQKLDNVLKSFDIPTENDCKKL